MAATVVHDASCTFLPHSDFIVISSNYLYILIPASKTPYTGDSIPFGAVCQGHW
jgi:hypothetical protein